MIFGGEYVFHITKVRIGQGQYDRPVCPSATTLLFLFCKQFQKLAKNSCLKFSFVHSKINVEPLQFVNSVISISL